MDQVLAGSTPVIHPNACEVHWCGHSPVTGDSTSSILVAGAIRPGSMVGLCARLKNGRCSFESNLGHKVGLLER